jgi:hypothetical protein
MPLGIIFNLLLKFINNGGSRILPPFLFLWGNTW